MTNSCPVAIPVVHFIYPETNGRSLEEINLLFASPSILVSANYREYKRMVDEAGGNVAVAERRLLDSVDAAVKEGSSQSLEDNSSSEKKNVHMEEFGEKSSPAESTA